MHKQEKNVNKLIHFHMYVMSACLFLHNKEVWRDIGNSDEQDCF